MLKYFGVEGYTSQWKDQFESLKESKMKKASLANFAHYNILKWHQDELLGGLGRTDPPHLSLGSVPKFSSVSPTEG